MLPTKSGYHKIDISNTEVYIKFGGHTHSATKKANETTLKGLYFRVIKHHKD